MSQAGHAAAAMPAFQEACTPRHGRHLVATQDIKPGQVVLDQQPYAAVLYDDQVSLRCDWCFNMAPPGAGLMRCTRSKLAHYCSKEHQRMAWKAYYRHECASLLECAPKVPPATVRLAARVLWRKQSELQSHQVSLTDTPSSSDWLLQQQAGGTYADIEALLSHWEDLDDVRKLQYAQMAVLTREFMQKGQQQQQQQRATPVVQATAEATPVEPAAGVRDIALLLARFACNNHTICDDELRPMGVGLYPLGALVNHHCRPSCVQTFAGRRIVFRSLGSVAAGHQLTISYVEVAATRQERRRQLLQQYFFDIDAAQHSGATQQNSSSTQHSTHAVQQQGQQQQQTHHDLKPPESSSAACLTNSMLQSGLERLQVQVQLQDVQQPLGTACTAALGNLRQQQQQQLLQLTLWAAVSENAALQRSSSGSSPSQSPHCNLQHQHGATNSIGQPPFPQDTSDPQLCRMLLLSPGPRCASETNNSSCDSCRPPVPFPGGMCLLLELLTGKPPQQDSCAAAGMLAGLFQDLEVLTNAGDAADCEVAAESGLVQKVRGLQLKAADSKAQHRQTRLEAVQWGAWGQAVQALLQEQQQQRGSLTSDTTNGPGCARAETPSQQPACLGKAVVMAAAGCFMYVWHLQQQAECCIHAGRPAEAVQLCQAALEAADGHRQAPVVCTPVQHVAAEGGQIPPDDMLALSPAQDCSEMCLHDSAVRLQQPAGIGAQEGMPAGLRVALGPEHILRIRVLASLLCAAVQDSQWQLGLQAARELVPLYIMVYPKVWPNLGLHYGLLAKLELLLEQPAAAARAAAAAAGILHITHGSTSTVLRDVHQILYDAQQEMALQARGAE